MQPNVMRAYTLKGLAVIDFQKPLTATMVSDISIETVGLCSLDRLSHVNNVPLLYVFFYYALSFYAYICACKPA